jgi:hypothetical protein
MINKDRLKPASPNQLSLDASFSMHGEGLLKPTKQEAGTIIHLEFPFLN